MWSLLQPLCRSSAEAALNEFCQNFIYINRLQGVLPWRLSGKESACQYREHVLSPWSGRPHMLQIN